MYRIVQYKKIGNGMKERLIVKTFKDSDSMFKFLNKGDNGLKWKQVTDENMTYLRTPYPAKAGTYAAAGGSWHNVKHLDASILAHI